jgi:putative tricarboxylic transport membrane protein
MALDRWIALIILVISIVYGYAAYFTMDQLLPPFMQRNPVWPSTFPKVLSVLAIITSLIILLGLEKPATDAKEPDIDYRRLGDYNIGQAALLVGMMVLYALTLRPLGFFISTVGFLTLSAAILGERKFHILIPITTVAAFVIWYLVEQVLGIFLRPLPTFMIGG